MEADFQDFLALCSLCCWTLRISSNAPTSSINPGVEAMRDKPSSLVEPDFQNFWLCARCCGVSKCYRLYLFPPIASTSSINPGVEAMVLCGAGFSTLSSLERIVLFGNVTDSMDAEFIPRVGSMRQMPSKVTRGGLSTFSGFGGDILKMSERNLSMCL